jgi:hypothetical protein
MSEKPNALEPTLIAEHRRTDIFFDSRKMSPPTNKFVCWIDVMGSQSAMLHSLPTAANFLMKLHIAALTAYDAYNLDVYPVIDGVYLCSPSLKKMLGFINKTYSIVAGAFISQENHLRKFLIRSGLAFGPVISGTETLGCADVLKNHAEYVKRIFLGSPLTNAYQIEKKSAPFGVGIHETAKFEFERLQIFTTMSGTHWKWWRHPEEIPLASELFTSLKSHYEWALKHPVTLSYEKTDIERHKSLAEEYFSPN